eukprot:7753417-Pyramimonas_sp.AAC.2
MGWFYILAIYSPVTWAGGSLQALKAFVQPEYLNTIQASSVAYSQQGIRYTAKALRVHPFVTRNTCLIEPASYGTRYHFGKPPTILSPRSLSPARSILDYVWVGLSMLGQRATFNANSDIQSLCNPY